LGNFPADSRARELTPLQFVSDVAREQIKKSALYHKVMRQLEADSAPGRVTEIQLIYAGDCHCGA
jgi:hypothetical protein